ncbi:hypothetical protein ECPA42_1348, partial [Escherichia coli PA42]
MLAVFFLNKASVT